MPASPALDEDHAAYQCENESRNLPATVSERAPTIMQAD
jgi:hypothetical protein